jgi:hypothetical protein
MICSYINFVLFNLLCPIEVNKSIQKASWFTTAIMKIYLIKIVFNSKIIELLTALEQVSANRQIVSIYC